MCRDEDNRCVPYVGDPSNSTFYMELNAPKWKENIMQGDLRPAFFGDVVTQDNIGSPINKASANYDDHSNARFLRWLWRRCMAGADASPDASYTGSYSKADAQARASAHIGPYTKADASSHARSAYTRTDT